MQAQEFTVDQKDVKGALENSEVHKNQIERRVIEAVIWSQPILGVAQTRSTIRTLGGDYNELVYLSQHFARGCGAGRRGRAEGRQVFCPLRRLQRRCP